MQYLATSQNDRKISVCFQGKPFNITIIQAYAPTTNAEEVEVEQFYEDLQDILELTPQKGYPFHCRGLEAKVQSQEIPGVTGKFGFGVQNKVGKMITEFCQENALVIVNTHFQQHKRRLYARTLPDGQYQNQIDYILCSQRWKSSIQSANKICGSDLELLIAKFRLKLKKVRKTTRPFSSVQFSHSVVSDSLRPHELQHARPPCPLPTPGAHPNSYPSSR